MIREAVEDYIRHKQDQISNSQDIYVTYQNDKKKSDLESMSSFKKGQSSLLKVGDLVKVHESELFAADMVLIATSNSDGTCFVQTAQLDGEKSLKKKHIPKGLAEVIPQYGEALDFHGKCEADAPGRDLEKFCGKVEFKGRTFPLTNN